MGERSRVSPHQVPAMLQGMKRGFRPASQRALVAFLAESSSSAALLSDVVPPGEANAYEFQSVDVVEMLEQLQDKFRDQVTALEKEEMGRRHAYETLAQDRGTWQVRDRFGVPTGLSLRFLCFHDMEAITGAANVWSSRGLVKKGLVLTTLLRRSP